MYKNILVGVDGSPASNLALSEVSKMASSDSAVCIVTVVENPSWSIPLEYGVVYDVELMRKSLREAGKDILERAKSTLAAQGVEARVHLIDLTTVTSNNIPLAILHEAEEWPADLIVIGTHGRRGFNRLLMGSVAERLVRISTKPVLLVRGSLKAGKGATPSETSPQDTAFSGWPEDEYMGS